MTGGAIVRGCSFLALSLAALLTVQPRPVAGQTDAERRRAVRVLETVQPSTGRRSLHVMEGLSPDEIRAVQGALSRAGFGVSWREGSLDPFTRGALQRFQTQRGLAVCACVSLETLVELDLRVRVAETIVLEEPRGPGVVGAEEVGGVAGAGVEPREGTSAYVDFGRYYPYGVMFLAPYAPYLEPFHGPRVAGRRGLPGHAGPGFAIGAHVGSALVGGSVGSVPAIGPSPAVRALGPFPRVAAPPNVVRGSG